jgi:hypothetical protein
MNEQNLTRGSVLSNLRAGVTNAYERLAGSDDYKKNERDLKIIQFCVVTISAIATGYVNAFAHVERLGLWPAIGVALLVTGFVECFYFALRHGLTTTYKSGAQRFYAQIWYRILQATMILNAMLLGLWIVGINPPAWLLFYNHYSIGIHFAAALIGVSMVRDSDAVVQNRILELRAETGRQDLITARKAAAIGSPLSLIAAKTRGVFDAIALSFRLLFGGGGFSKKYMEQINQIADEQYSYLDTLPGVQPTQAVAAQRRPGFINNESPQETPQDPPQDSPPKALARWI